jgi:predicted HicB family RNase H-like nuclease
MKGAVKTGIIAVRLEPEIKRRAEAIAAADGRTVSAWVGRLIAREVEAHAPTPPRKRPK